MKQSIIYFFIVISFLESCKHKEDAPVNTAHNLNAREVLDGSIAFHDPKDRFKSTRFDIHLQEPRIQNPYRFSKLTIDNGNKTFKLLRNRGDRIVEYSKNIGGNLQVLMDGKVERDTSMVRKFKLDTNYLNGYNNYYNMIIGLPMSLKANMKDMKRAENVEFNGRDCYKLEALLNKSIISKKWVVYFDQYDFSVQGLEIVDEEEPNKGEKIVFQSLIEIDSIKYPKMRHWSDRQTNDYLATDILLFNSDILVEEPWFSME